MRPVPHALAERLNQVRLADAGLPGEQDHLPLAGRGLAPQLREQSKLVLAPNCGDCLLYTSDAADE